jgi:hypothetical protein
MRGQGVAVAVVVMVRRCVVVLAPPMRRCRQVRTPVGGSGAAAVTRGCVLVRAPTRPCRQVRGARGGRGVAAAARECVWCGECVRAAVRARVIVGVAARGLKMWRARSGGAWSFSFDADMAWLRRCGECARVAVRVVVGIAAERGEKLGQMLCGDRCRIRSTSAHRHSDPTVRVEACEAHPLGPTGPRKREGRGDCRV